VNLLTQAEDLLLRFGGHPAAAGFSLEEANLSAFEARLLESVEAQSDGLRLEPSLAADLQLEAADLTLELVKDLAALEPHGKGNERPLIWIGPVRLSGLKALKDKHLKAGLRVGNDWVDLIWWNAAEHLDAIQSMSQVEVMGRIEINRWRDREKVQIMVETLREA